MIKIYERDNGDRLVVEDREIVNAGYFLESTPGETFVYGAFNDTWRHIGDWPYGWPDTDNAYNTVLEQFERMRTDPS